MVSGVQDTRPVNVIKGRLLVCLLALVTTTCATLPRAPAGSCMQRTVDSLHLSGLPGNRQHCLASGTIALRCGSASAWMAGYGKEMADLFGHGRFQRQDLRANAAGRECAASLAEESLAGEALTDQAPVSDERLADCCAARGY